MMACFTHNVQLCPHPDCVREKEGPVAKCRRLEAEIEVLRCIGRDLIDRNVQLVADRFAQELLTWQAIGIIQDLREHPLWYVPPQALDPRILFACSSSESQRAIAIALDAEVLDAAIASKPKPGDKIDCAECGQPMIRLTNPFQIAGGEVCYPCYNRRFQGRFNHPNDGE